MRTGRNLDVAAVPCAQVPPHVRSLGTGRGATFFSETRVGRSLSRW